MTSPPCQRPSLFVVGPECWLQCAAMSSVPSCEGVAVVYKARLCRDACNMGGAAVFVEVTSFLAKATAVQQDAPLYLVTVLVAPRTVVIVGTVVGDAGLADEGLACHDLLVGEE